jgi:lipopolysaccharide transport system ATP-binding protein
MGDRVIQAAGIGKRYALGVRRGYETLRESIVRSARGRLKRRTREASSTFWALRDVSFEVRRGEAVAIIGRNGAGKSTLLKVLSRITAPTEGKVLIRGRVGSLLEVGTGFHPELTGRENVFLNGAVLGMRRAEVTRRFDEIVAYSEVEKFIDTPVKHYSSGMYMRLAFSVAAHLEPDVLVIDEVLAVGDAEFQKKCMGKMSDVARSGRTVLFVSHNMSAVRSLCDRGILLDEGKIVHDGSVENAVRAYLSRSGPGGGASWRRLNAAAGSLSLVSASARLEGEQPVHRLCLDMVFESSGVHAPAFVAIDILDGLGGTIMQALPTTTGFLRADKGTQRVQVEIDLPGMVPGTYPVTIWAGSHNTETLDIVRECLRFEVTGTPTEGRTFPHHTDHGFVVPLSRVRCAPLLTSLEP